MTHCLIVNASPKQGRNASGMLGGRVGALLHGTADRERLRTQADARRIASKLANYDTLLIALPLYVDSVPSHVARFMEEVQALSQERPLHLSVYVMANSGFIEGNQNATLMQVMENFCRHCHLEWGGGVGIGGGVMLSVIRLLLWPTLALALAAALLLWLVPGAAWAAGLLRYAVGYTAIYLLFNAGVYFHTLRLARAITGRKQAGVRYTRVMVPTSLFLLMANLFFTLTSLFRGGLFRGWLSQK